MKIKEITFEHGNDFSAIMVCEHCGHEQENNSGYHDNYYHTEVISAMYCQGCGKNRKGEVNMKAETKYTLGSYVAYRQDDGLFTVRSTLTGQRVAKDMYEGDAIRLASVPDLYEALNDLFEHCAMIHKNWGENCNSQQADAAVARARAAIAKATGGGQ